ncbi:MAG: helix-turn-helix domain-containing protein [Spirochaetes bacterium]|nr:helix-turn-helix domain-containing protein [Spirochaetota bacterium]MBU0956438.1 helix-turn-helix domain-containing protein [Spirochaetota bacterium]
MDYEVIAELLHPVRLRILQELLTAAQCTASQLALALPNTPQATLYRHLKAMVKANILEITSETPVRGMVERTYELKHNPFAELNANGATLPNKQLLNLFFSFMLTQLGDCTEYLKDENKGIETERFGFRTFLLKLNDDELGQFIQEFGQLLQRYSQRTEAEGRRVHKFSFSLIPVRV